MDEAQRIELLCDAMAEFLFGVWQEEQHRTAATAAPSADEPASAIEANSAGEQESQSWAASS